MKWGHQAGLLGGLGVGQGVLLTSEQWCSSSDVLPAALEVEQAGGQQAAQEVWEMVHQVLAGGVEELPEVQGPSLLQVFLESG